jgi:hypothetical protein
MACSINRLPRSVPAAMALAPRTKKLLRFIVIANSFPYLFNQQHCDAHRRDRKEDR